MKKFLDYLASTVVTLVIVFAFAIVLFMFYQRPSDMALMGGLALAGWSFIRVLDNMEKKNKEKGEDDGNH